MTGWMIIYIYIYIYIYIHMNYTNFITNWMGISSIFGMEQSTLATDLMNFISAAYFLSDLLIVKKKH